MSLFGLRQENEVREGNVKGRDIEDMGTMSEECGRTLEAGRKQGHKFSCGSSRRNATNVIP